MQLPSDPSLDLLSDLLEIIKWCQEQPKAKAAGAQALSLKDSAIFEQRILAVGVEHGFDANRYILRGAHDSRCYCTCWLKVEKLVLTEVKKKMQNA